MGYIHEIFEFMDTIPEASYIPSLPRPLHDVSVPGKVFRFPRSSLPVLAPGVHLPPKEWTDHRHKNPRRRRGRCLSLMLQPLGCNMRT